MFIMIDIGAGGRDRIDALIEAGAEILRLDAAHRVDGAGLPDHQSRLVVGQDFRQTSGHIRRGLPRLDVRGHLDFNARQSLLERLFHLRRIGKACPVGAGQRRGSRADDADIQPVPILDFVADPRQFARPPE